MKDASFRARLVARRTYNRPLPEGGYETWEQTISRVIHHQHWLWERALGRYLTSEEHFELDALRKLMLDRKALPSGRILWMGGTDQASRTEISMFNCAFLEIRDVWSVVDAYYLLLNGCGVGFKPVSGLLNGFAKQCRIEVVRSERTDKGLPGNMEFFTNYDGERVWRLMVGDSGKAWAKALGKLLAFKKPVDRIILDFRNIRPAGITLSGYGWRSSGDEQISKAFAEICMILNSKADRLLDEIDIVDIINLAGTTLSSRRAAQIAMLDAEHPLALRFASMKQEHHIHAPWRSQSNNTLVFHSRPSVNELRGLLSSMLEAGGSEPGLYNGENARRRAPWFAGTNPCGEILLPDGGLCNLVDVNIAAFDNFEDLRDAVKLIARANYRQTCVDLRDDVLSARWHETNKFLRLCGVGLTGIVKGGADFTYEEYEWLGCAARNAANSMAKELGLPKPKAVTTIKPSGTLSKIMDTTEGLHAPLGRYVFNNIKFDKSDPLIPKLRDANYWIQEDPYGTHNYIVTIPVDNGVEPKHESAVAQLERYALLMDYYVDHNASVTISYSPDEIGEIARWLNKNWDRYVGVSFILRTDPTKTAADLGYPYLPQEVVSKWRYDTYVSTLTPIDIDGGDMLDVDECAGGACPVR